MAAGGCSQYAHRHSQPRAEAARRRRRPGERPGGAHLDEDGHAGVVLGRGAHHRRAADVDVLDAHVERRALGDGRGERVEVDDDEVDGLAAELAAELLAVGRRVAHQDAAVHARMQRLDAAVHHLGRLGVLGDIGARNAGVANGLCGAAGGEDGHARGVEALDEVGEARLVRHGDERAKSHLAGGGPGR